MSENVYALAHPRSSVSVTFAVYLKMYDPGGTASFFQATYMYLLKLWKVRSRLYRNPCLSKKMSPYCYATVTMQSKQEH